MAGLSRAAFPLRGLALARHTPLCRRIHTSPCRAAVAHPVTAHGPPPKAPAPSPDFKEHAEQLEEVDSRSASAKLPDPSRATVSLKKRFWKDVHVHGKQGRCPTVHYITHRKLVV
jgi:ATP synthase F1 complex assembly factor 2